MRDTVRTEASVDAPVALDDLWKAPAILLMMVAAEGLALLLTLAIGSDSPWRHFGTASVATQWILLLTLAELYVFRHPLRRLRLQAVAQIGLGLLLANAWILASLAWTIFEPSVELDANRWGSIQARLLGIVLVAGLFGLGALHLHLKARRLAVRTKQAELEALQARIRPHFLFNTLNTGASLVHQRPEEAERLLLDLADLFRAALAGPREIPLEEELSLARRYLEIESLRFGERLRIEWQLPREIPHAMVPALSIQPLVENAIRHGVERIPHGGRVEISLTTTPEHVVVRITNPVALSELGKPVSHHVGLNASQARIEALTGGRGSVQTGRQGELYVATVRLPRRPAAPPARGKWR